MNKNKLLKKINFLEYYLIIGGLVGIILQVDTLISINLDNYQSSFIYMTLYAPFVFFVFSIYNGVLLSYKKYELGLKLASYSFYFQLFAFTAFGICFEYYLGIGFNITLELTNDTFFGLHFNFSQLILRTLTNVNIFIVQFNVFALFMIYYISKITEAIKKDLLVRVVDDKLNEIGVN